MGRRGNGKRTKYLPGVTWRDVLKRRPVTAEEQRQKREKPNLKKPFVCRDCAAKCALYVPFGRLTRNSRCSACGGVLDPIA